MSDQSKSDEQERGKRKLHPFDAEYLAALDRRNKGNDKKQKEWTPGISLQSVYCANCGNHKLRGEEAIPPESPYDFHIKWLCTDCGDVVRETKGYDCQFDEVEMPED